MKIVMTSISAAALGLAFGVSAYACDFHVQHVTAAATPAPATDTATTPATTVDPVRLVQLEKAAILPAVPKEEPAGDAETN